MSEQAHDPVVEQDCRLVSTMTDTGGPSCQLCDVLREVYDRGQADALAKVMADASRLLEQAGYPQLLSQILSTEPAAPEATP
jgi:hypothetical protein